jgi:outer membrane receptor protein involved in Fe transport
MSLSAWYTLVDDLNVVPMELYLNAYPVPNGSELFKPCAPNVNGCPASGQQPTGLAQFNAGFSNPSSLDAYSIRVDQALSPKFSFFGRYNYSPSSLGQRGSSTVFGPVLSSTQSASYSVQTLTVGLTEMINQRISNEVRANYSNDRVSSKFALDNFGGAVPLPDSLLFPPGVSSTNGFFEFIILNTGELAQGKFGIDEQRQVNLVDNLSATKGGHQMKFGVDYRWLSPFSSPLSYGQFAVFLDLSSNPGGALSGSAPGATSTTPLDAGSLAIQSNAPLAQNFSFYGQDDWKITPRLTITYGLRWDINPPLKDKNSANDPLTVVGLNDPATISLAARGTPLYQTTYGNLAPRLGLAYQLGERPNWGPFSAQVSAYFTILGTAPSEEPPATFPSKPSRTLGRGRFR